MGWYKWKQVLDRRQMTMDAADTVRVTLELVRLKFE
jgi:hypothetical protein